MKTFILTLLLTSTLFAQDITLINHTVNWTGYGAIGGYSLTGTLAIKSAQFVTNEEQELSSGEIVFDMRSIAHENERLMNHLKEEDFFYVRKYPTARFTIEEITPTLLKGHLIMRGVSKGIEVPYTLEKTAKGLKLSGSTEIDRTKYGINYNSNSFFKNLGSQAIKDNFRVDFSLVVQ